MIAWANRAWVTVEPNRAGFQSGPKQLVFHPVPSSACLTTPGFLLLPHRLPLPLAPSTVIHGSARGRQQPWALLRQQSSSSSCCSYVILSIALCKWRMNKVLEASYIRPLLCVPGGQRPSGRWRSRVPCLHLAGKAISWAKRHGQSTPRSGL